jgi:hypothetical protein
LGQPEEFAWQALSIADDGMLNAKTIRLKALTG